ncbi:MAG: type III-B CRISPR module RAMP protein Cmr4 [Chloroflexi bacterium]|nr:type III-B CRISPR module RAMP protein Cmr4 [Chloroflexota bacterium]
MFEAKSILFIYVETPLHAGTGRGLGAVDLPIQRERITGYPIVQASSLKGRLRAASDPNFNSKVGLTKAEHLAIFGPETGNASEYAGALSTGDARILLFPVRSLAGVFAWTTSRDALARFLREAQMVGLPVDWQLPAEPGKDTALVSGEALIAGQSVVLEEFSFTPDKNQADKVKNIGEWLANNALPQRGYNYWKQALPNKLCILPEDVFRDFVLYGTEVQTHIKLDHDKKTVQSGALWTTESLPVDTLLYAPLMATRSRASGVDLSGQQILTKVKSLGLVHTQLGSDETTGQGMVALRFTDSRGNPSQTQSNAAAGGGQ